jgi:hypothetical protein
MKRYRISCFDFDARANILNMEIKPEWKQKIKEQCQKNKKIVEEGLLGEFGTIDGQNKINRFRELGAKPISIIAHHNMLLNQTRSSYIQGGFYPALTSSCALGERILNHLMLDLRDGFNHLKEEPLGHPCNECEKFKELKAKGLIKIKFDLYSCADCSNWNIMIKELEKWDVLNVEVSELFQKLSGKRHKSIHFNPKTIQNLKSESLETIKILQDIIQKLFPAFGSDYFIPAKGEAFLKKELESKPFFKKYYLPNSTLVSPYHRVKTVTSNLEIEDVKIENDTKITDDEFIRLREDFNKNGILPK